MDLRVPVPDELVEAVARRVLELLNEHGPNGSEPWIGVEEAATHIGASKHRVYALCSARRIPHERDGSRLLFRKSELDEWVRSGGGRRP